MGRFLATSMLCLLIGGATARANDLSSDLQPRVGRGTAPKNARGSGPWMTRVMLATSTNGLNFRRLQFVLSDQAGVPNAMVDHDKKARIYYIDYGNGNVIACALQRSADSLTNWTYRRVRISGLPERGSDPVDPTVVCVNSNEYRLYFMQARPRPTIYSALSSNGIDFALEPGIRFAGEATHGMSEPVFDPVVLKTGETWRIWTGPDGRFSGEGDDGIAFRNTGPFIVEGVRFMPWSAASLPHGGFRLYGNFVAPGEWGGGVSSVSSTDGKKWHRDPGARLTLDGSKYRLESAIGPDNGCTPLPDGSWLMAYLATIPVPRGTR